MSFSFSVVLLDGSSTNVATPAFLAESSRWKKSMFGPESQFAMFLITIKNIANWDSGPNMLFFHLLDSAKNAGVATFVDDPSSNTTENEKDIVDDFANPRYHSQSNWLVAKGTGDTFLTSKSFTTTPPTFTYTFTAAQVQALNAYILNGHDIALGLD